MRDTVPTFNLWTEPWIALESSAGRRERLSIEKTLLRAHEFRSIYEVSPLYVVGIHRLLSAILQDAIRPQSPPDLLRLWNSGRFPAEAIRRFGDSYADRFDIFSADAPFLQSADLALTPTKDDRVKSVAYLSPETPTGSEITHYRHGLAEDRVFCAICLAAGLAAIPAFATSGGAGIKPSINGVPPIYVIPGGDSLFFSLAASLILPNYQPQVASRERDAAWWARPALVERSAEVWDVGYLHSLTFPARRVRLHAESLQRPCDRCGEEGPWGARTMVFDMGESRPKNAPFWQDPFAAYRAPGPKSGGAPTPIRPTAGRAMWREFASLFLVRSDATIRPSIVNQIANLGLGADASLYPFRCVGLRTDMKGKVFEWIDAGFEVPPALLADGAAGDLAQEAINFASDCAGILRSTFREVLGDGSKKQDRHQGLRVRLQDAFWAAMAVPYRTFILNLVGASLCEREQHIRRWADDVLQTGIRIFRQTIELVGDDAANLRRRVEGENKCYIRLAAYRKKQFPALDEEVTNV